MSKNKADKPSLATLMETFMSEQIAFNKAMAHDMAELRTSKPKASESSTGTTEPKAKTGKRKARKAPKRDIDVASFQSQKFPVSSDKATRKIAAWANVGNIARLREYAGLGPRTSGEGEPRIAVVEGNRLLAANVIAACFSKSGKPNAVNNAATSK